MEKVAPNSKFIGHFTEIIWQSKIKAPLPALLIEPNMERVFVRTNSVYVLHTRLDDVFTNGDDYTFLDA